MRKVAASRGHVVGPLVAVTLVGTLSACAGPSPVASSTSSAPGVSCGNYPIHANGKSYDEVSVRVGVYNSTGRTVLFTVDVAMSQSRRGRRHMPSQEVTIEGFVAPHSSAELGHKVLTSGPVECRVSRVRRS